MFHEIALVVCLATAIYSVAIEVAPPRPHNFQPRVALLKPTGFSVTISGKNIIIFTNCNGKTIFFLSNLTNFAFCNTMFLVFMVNA